MTFVPNLLLTQKKNPMEAQSHRSEKEKGNPVTQSIQQLHKMLSN